MIEDIIHQQTLTDLKILLAVACCLLFSPYLAKFLRLPISVLSTISSCCEFRAFGESGLLLLNVYGGYEGEFTRVFHAWAEFF